MAAWPRAAAVTNHFLSMKYRIIIFIAAALGALRAFAQPYCDVRTFTMRDGLAANVISGFLQADDGLMWFSTWIVPRSWKSR